MEPFCLVRLAWLGICHSASCTARAFWDTLGSGDEQTTVFPVPRCPQEIISRLQVKASKKPSASYGMVYFFLGLFEIHHVCPAKHATQKSIYL